MEYLSNQSTINLEYILVIIILIFLFFLLKKCREVCTKGKELENFIYILTHDFKQALKNIASLTNLLEEDYATNLGTSGIQLTNLIQENVTRTDTLMTAMMHYSMASKTDFEKHPVQLKLLFMEAYESFKLSYLHKSISFEVEDLPLVIGNKAALSQVCQNLVSNAFKYSSKNNHIIIRVAFEKDNEAFFIKDNGIGFDKAHKNKLFELFYRLENSKGFHGTGIGLTIATKIIQKHDGQIWANSTLGEGATFYFSLPLIQALEG